MLGTKKLCSVVRDEKVLRTNLVPTPYQAVPPRTNSVPPRTNSVPTSYQPRTNPVPSRTKPYQAVPTPYQAVPPRTKLVPTPYQPRTKGIFVAVLTPMKDLHLGLSFQGAGFSVPPFHLTFSSIVVSLIEWYELKNLSYHPCQEYQAQFN